MRTIAAAVLASLLTLSAGAQVAPACSDFHAYACEKWEAAHPLTPLKSATGLGGEITDRNRAILGDILESAAKPSAHRTAMEQKIGDYYASCMDEAAIERRGLATIRPELARIAAMKSKAALPRVLGHLHRITGNLVQGATAGSPVFGFGSSADPNDRNATVLAIDQAGLGLPDREYYLNDDAASNETRAAYTSTIAAMLKLSGESAANAAADAQTILSMETELARSEMDMVERRDPKHVSQTMSFAELQALTPHFDWNGWLTAVGSPRPKGYFVLSPGALRGFDALLQSRSLEDWKAYLRWNLLNFSANALPHRFVEARFAFYGKALFGRTQMTPLRKRCAYFADRDLGEAVGQEFVRRTFPPAAKARMLALVRTIETAFGEEIDSLDWMSEATKTQARIKLAAVLNKIGYPDSWPDYSSLTIKRGDILGNWYRTSAFEVARDLVKINNPHSRNDWAITPATVDAYYSAADNTVNFPAGLLQPPYFDPAADDATNFGAIGSTIAHELTHGFDDQGRTFDGGGNRRDWWTADDAAKFDERAKCIRDQYSGYIGIGDVHVNGALTVSENIADNGGLRIALRALHDRLKAQGKENEIIDGLTPDQRFFLSYAHAWCGSMSPETLRVMVQTGTHSPAPLRINGVVSNMPEFREAFACKPGDAMVRDPSCTVW
jgi:endothelin-converting enzyme/putative endopeptidase